MKFLIMKIILTIVFSIWSLTLIAQQQEVISSAGSFFENSSGSISFTIGECISSSLSSTSIILTQGFQQSKLNIVGIPNNKFLDYEIMAFPNPVKEFVTLKIEKPQGFTYKLYSMNGTIIENKIIVSTDSEINFNELPPSVYILRVFQNNEGVKSFKIIKR